MSDCPPATLPRSFPFHLHGSFESSDLDEIRSVAGAAQHPFTVQPGVRTSHMRFRLDHHPLSRVALTKAELDYSGQLHIWAPPLESHYFVQIPLRGGATVRHGARTVTVASGKAAVVLSPGPETLMRGHGGFEEITLEIDAAAVRRCWTDLAGEPPDEPISFHPALRLDSEPGVSIVRLIRFLAEEVSRPGSALATRPVLGRLEEALILCLLQGQPHSMGQSLRRRPATTTASVVGDAEAWMEARVAEPITMAAVAQAQGVTLRSLQRAFERHRAYSPRAFLHRVRLGRARAHLRRGVAGTVTRVAFDLGFRHLGRFSAAYRAQFGESPSRTLMRARRRGRVPGTAVAKRIDAAPGSAILLPERPQSERCGFCVGEVPAQ